MHGRVGVGSKRAWTCSKWGSGGGGVACMEV